MTANSEERAREHLALALAKRGATESARGVLNGSTELTVMAFIEAAIAFAAQPDGMVERYRHKVRGTADDLIGTAELQDATGSGVEEGALLAIYRGDDGKLWARRHREFGDGRFERVSAAVDEGA